MRKIVNSTFISLDGIVNHLDRWHFDYVDADTDALALEQLRGADGLLLGRKTYEVYAAVWPERDGELATIINTMPKYVASTTLTDPGWQNASVLEGDLVTAAGALRSDPSGDGTILMHGYGPVARTLLANGLLDELHLWVHPELAGVGGVEDMLFHDGQVARLETIGTTTFGSGVVVLSYRAADS
jgi:dihydrofolate reductase